MYLFRGGKGAVDVVAFALFVVDGNNSRNEKQVALHLAIVAPSPG